MSEKLDLILKELHKMNMRIDTMEKNMDIRIDTMETNMNNQFASLKNDVSFIKEQTAENAEQKSVINDVTEKISDLESDVKLLKRLITNQ